MAADLWVVRLESAVLHGDGLSISHRAVVGNLQRAEAHGPS